MMQWRTNSSRPFQRTLYSSPWALASAVALLSAVILLPASATKSANQLSSAVVATSVSGQKKSKAANSSGSPAKSGQAKTGPSLFAAKCAGCHGAKGEGGPVHPGPMVGVMSQGDLEKYILKNMPPSGTKLNAAEAKLVTQHVYDTVYSPIAQERNKPAAVALSRLTVRQFRNAVTDLFNRNDEAVPWFKENGLRGRYFKSRYFDNKTLGITRVDPEVTFDFGVEAPKATEGQPAASGFDPKTYSIVWDGSIIAPDSGEYEFIVDSNQAVRLYVNNQEKPVVDGWVQSGSQTEYSGRSL